MSRAPRHHRPRAGLVLALLSAALSIGVGSLSAADPIVLEGLGGGRLSEADLERGDTVVVVWASWSPRCRDIVPRVNALAARWGSRARVVTVVFQEPPEDVRRFLGGEGLEVPVYLDAAGTFSKKHAVTTLPGLLIFRDGRRAYDGKLPPDPDDLLTRTLG